MIAFERHPFQAPIIGLLEPHMRVEVIERSALLACR